MNENELRAVTGTIFNIQHFCIHDGPGIRTNVFVKGCPLHCIWCANPESQSRYPQLMYRADSCVGCGACAAVCPQAAISPVEKADTRHGFRVRTDRGKCSNCGACVSVCKAKAREISGRTVTVGEVFDEVAGDALFYGEDGGITVTGGEALAQPEFTKALLTLCKSAGITTCIETCGFARWEIMEPILRLTDVVLYDIKETNPVRHKEYTGVDNTLILDNLKKVNDSMDCEIWVRVPTIPGYNDETENLNDLGKFVSVNLNHCTQVHLLPFHKLGLGKLEQLEAERNFSSEVPKDAYMEQLRDIVRSYGLICK